MRRKKLKKPIFNCRFWPQLLYCLLMPVYLEVVVHLFVYKGVTARIVYPILFALACGMLLFALVSLLPEKVARIAICVLTGAFCVYFNVQLVYHSIFGEFMSIWQVSAGTMVITNFYQAMFYSIFKAWLPVLTIFVPLPVILILTGKKILVFERLGWVLPLCALALTLAMHFLTVGVMAINDHSAFSVYQLYRSADTATEISVKNIGVISTLRQELKYIILGKTPQTAEYGAEGEFSQVQWSPEFYNVSDADLKSLYEKTDNPTLQKLDRYFGQISPTRKNKYTGLFEGYNLITICAESFSPYLISEELTPALYKLSTGGFVFENYFGTFASNTTNGEYALCMGLYPDLTRSKSTASFYASQQNYLPYCLGNEMKKQGAACFAYHNYSGDYYARNVTHPNMGYVFKSAGDGLDIALSWPASDLEMMEKSIGDYLSADRQFCVYYMTFSGHYQYTWDNPMSAKNREKVENLPYSEEVKAFVACNLELEYALEYLMDELEKAGIADKTVIMLTNDHYPYGLSQEQYDDLAGRPVDTTFERFRNSFICYCPTVTETVDTYCSTVDILPTLLNLFGLPYDSRMLIGKDVLSPDATNVAVLSDQSFVTKDFAFDASSGTITTYAKGDFSENIAAIQKQIAMDMQISADMLNQDYYAHAILGKDSTAESSLTEYPFTDIPETFSLGILQYIYDNGYMDAVSETKFGFDVPCAFAELLDTLYRIEGSPPVQGKATYRIGSSNVTVTGKYAAAVRWAQTKGIIPEGIGIDSYTVLTRKQASLILYNYAKLKGADLTVDEAALKQYLASYPNVGYEEARALCWCFEQSIARLDGTLSSVFDHANQKMTRYYALTMVYNLHLIVDA